MFKVNVSPDMGMYHLLRSQGYDQAYAVAEFIDNALEAQLQHTKGAAVAQDMLVVNLRFYSNDFAKADLRNSLIVEDNGPGIKKSRLADAMKPAKPSPTKGLSEFGIGMKAAAVWFSDKWTLSTKPAGGSLRYNLTFDLPSLLKGAKDTVEVTERKNHDPSGTTITLHHLRRPIDKAKFESICNELREIYQRYTAGAAPRLKLTTSYNDTPIPKPLTCNSDRAVLQAPKHRLIGGKHYSIGDPKPWRVAIDIVFEGVRVEGFICLLERGSYVDNPGLVMFRGERVIKGTVQRPNLPSTLFKTSNKYARQRVYGHLFVDDLPVTYTKDGFEIDEQSFFDQIRAVDGMAELLRQAEEYRAKQTNTIVVGDESQVPGAKDSKPTPFSDPGATNAGGKGGKGGKGGNGSTKQSSTKPVRARPSELVALLNDIKDKTPTIALKSIIEETIYQHQFRREIATALCLRMVLEFGLLDYIERKLPGQYANVSDRGVQSLINYMNGNLRDFFDAKRDHRAIKCVQSIVSGSQADVVLLNNVAHAHYQPNLKELNTFAVNLEPLLRWAFK